MTLRAGELVRHRKMLKWDLGKVVYADGSDVWVYFKGMPAAIPEERVSRFALSNELLEPAPGVADSELENLPPFVGGKFIRKVTSLNFIRAKALFQKAYPLGFGDSKYHDPIAGERPYKLAAHRRFLDAEVVLRQLVQSGTGETIERALRALYFGEKSENVAALNLMHPRFEAPHFFSALRDTEYARRFLKAALGFIYKPDRPAFEEYAGAVEVMQWKEGGTRTGLWPLLTWLPFVANPAVHMMIRPTIAMEFASIMPFHLKFESELDFHTYERVLLMSKDLLRLIQDSELNISKRPLDMIDIQSFMWVTIKYFEPGVFD